MTDTDIDSTIKRLEERLGIQAREMLAAATEITYCAENEGVAPEQEFKRLNTAMSEARMVNKLLKDFIDTTARLNAVKAGQ